MSKKIKSIYFASSAFPDQEDERRSKLRSPPPPPSQLLDNDEEGEMDELDVEQRSKLRSPPPPSQHQDEEGELEDDEIENDLDVEIADIAEQKKVAMEDLDKNNDDEKSKSHLLHSASFYGYTGPICPQTPSKKANKEEKKEEEVEDGEWAGWEEEEEGEGEHLQTGPGGHGRLMERSDTKYCLIVSSDYRLTPRKIPLSPAASSFLVEEEEEEEEEVEWEIDEAFKEEESEELLKPSTDLILVDSHEDSNEIKETKEGQIVPVEEKGNSEKNLFEDECDSSSASGGEEEEESLEKANSNTGPKKNQTEHRLVVKKDKMARGILMMIPLETIRKRRKQQAQQDCLEDILNYV